MLCWQLWHRGSTKQKKIGTVTVPLSVVLTVDNMTVVKQLQVTDISPTCTLTVHLSLRVCTVHVWYQHVYCVTCLCHCFIHFWHVVSMCNWQNCYRYVAALLIRTVLLNSLISRNQRRLIFHILHLFTCGFYSGLSQKLVSTIVWPLQTFSLCSVKFGRSAITLSCSNFWSEIVTTSCNPYYQGLWNWSFQAGNNTFQNSKFVRNLWWIFWSYSETSIQTKTQTIQQSCHG